MDAFVLRLFLSVWSEKTPKTPSLSPMADDAITQGGKLSLGSPVYICECATVAYTTNQSAPDRIDMSCVIRTH